MRKLLPPPLLREERDTENFSKKIHFLSIFLSVFLLFFLFLSNQIEKKDTSNCYVGHLHAENIQLGTKQNIPSNIPLNLNCLHSHSEQREYAHRCAVEYMCTNCGALYSVPPEVCYDCGHTFFIFAC